MMTTLETSFDNIAIKPLVVRGRHGDIYQLVAARLLDEPAWGGNRCASRSTANSVLRWNRHDVACEWEVLRAATVAEAEAYLRQFENDSVESVIG